MDENILVAAVPVGSFPMDSESAQDALGMVLRCGGLCSWLSGPLCLKSGGCVLTDSEKKARVKSGLGEKIRGCHHVDDALLCTSAKSLEKPRNTGLFVDL